MSIVVGIAGGSGSGKTTLVDAILRGLDAGAVARLEQDSYYRDRPELTFEERALINYDHPDSIDNALLVDHIRQLVNGHAVEKPTYDFTTHSRRAETVRVEPAEVILVDGILVLENQELRSLMTLRLYVDTDADVRFIRRLRRDMTERGRTLESVIDQYLTTVRPMHLEFVEPSKRYADLIIPEGGLNEAASEMIVARLQGLIGEVVLPGTPAVK